MTMKNFVVPLIIGVVLGAIVMYFYQNSQVQELTEKVQTFALTGDELQETEAGRKQFTEKLKSDTSRVLSRARGERITKNEAQKRIKDYDDLRKLLHRTGPSKGKHFSSGFGFGLDEINQLIADIEAENDSLRSSGAADSLLLTGLRIHMSLKEGIKDGHLVDYFDAIITPSRYNGESIFEWQYIIQANLTGDPPPLDTSNPCPDACP